LEYIYFIKIGQPKLSVDQGVDSSIVTFSKKPSEQILIISIIGQPILPSLSLLAHRSVAHVLHILIWLIDNEELTR